MGVTSEMAELEPQKHGGALYRPAKGETANPNGRPKRIYTVLKESGYSKEDIRDAFEEIGWQTLDDLQAILNDDSKPVVLKVIARAFIKGAEKGDFRYISEILQHTLGKPKEQTENKHLHKILVEYVNANDTTIQAPPWTDPNPE